MESLIDQLADVRLSGRRAIFDKNASRCHKFGRKLIVFVPFKPTLGIHHPHRAAVRYQALDDLLDFAARYPWTVELKIRESDPTQFKLLIDYIGSFHNYYQLKNIHLMFIGLQHMKDTIQAEYHRGHDDIFLLLERDLLPTIWLADTKDLLRFVGMRGISVIMMVNHVLESSISVNDLPDHLRTEEGDLIQQLHAAINGLPGAFTDLSQCSLTRLWKLTAYVPAYGVDPDASDNRKLLNIWTWVGDRLVEGEVRRYTGGGGGIDLAVRPKNEVRAPYEGVGRPYFDSEEDPEEDPEEEEA